MTEFDHRFAEVVAVTKTKQDGSFKLEVLEEGTYNFVVQKQGFGWKYMYPVRKVATFQCKVNIMKYMVWETFKSFFKITNGVNNVIINYRSTT